MRETICTASHCWFFKQETDDGEELSELDPLVVVICTFEDGFKERDVIVAALCSEVGPIVSWAGHGDP